MLRFYELLRLGLAPAEALREAKEGVRRSHPVTFASPWTWAGFILIGDGGAAEESEEDGCPDTGDGLATC